VSDRLYEKVPFRHSEIEHRYGPNVHILSNPYLLSQLAQLCAKDTIQPAINRLVVDIYGRLLEDVMNAEFPRVVRDVATRSPSTSPAPAPSRPRPSTTSSTWRSTRAACGRTTSS